MHTPTDPGAPGGVTVFSPDLPLDAEPPTAAAGAGTGRADMVGTAETVGTADPSPVFVDGTGRRRKSWRRLTLVVVAALCGYAVLLGIGFAGGPIPPAALLPIPGVPGNAPDTTGPPAPGADSTTGAPSAAGPSHATGSKNSRASEAAPHTGSSATSAKPPQATTATSPAPPSTTPSAGTSSAPTGTSAATSSPVHGPSATPPSHSHSNTKSH
ncbi:MAG: hypothetical protein HOV83_12435 [Catenulispora sp.]|nr:hypothetical protein [Catenulispora sp.]